MFANSVISDWTGTTNHTVCTQFKVKILICQVYRLMYFGKRLDLDESVIMIRAPDKIEYLIIRDIFSYFSIKPCYDPSSESLRRFRCGVTTYAFSLN